MKHELPEEKEIAAMLATDEDYLPPELEARMRTHLKQLESNVKDLATGTGKLRGAGLKWIKQQFQFAQRPLWWKKFAVVFLAIISCSISIIYWGRQSHQKGGNNIAQLSDYRPNHDSASSALSQGVVYSLDGGDAPEASKERRLGILNRPAAGVAGRAEVGKMAGKMPGMMADMMPGSQAPAKVAEKQRERVDINFAYPDSAIASALGSPASEAIKSEFAKNRNIIYAANLTLRVANLTVARDQITTLITQNQAIIARATLTQIIFRIAPDKFDAALTQLATLGEVADRNVQSEDVTDQYRDLALRTDVADGSRKRLMELLSRAGAVKDVLEVERDIRRLTEEIETLKGQQRAMADRFELATITVQLEEKALVQEPVRQRAGSPFEWVNALGIDRALVSVSQDAPIKGGPWYWRWFSGPRFKFGVPEGQLLPEGFVTLLYTRDQLIGATPEDYRLRVARFKTRQKGDLNYWARAAADEFSNFRGYVVKAPQPVALKNKKLRAIVLRCETTMNSQPWAYELWLVQRTDKPKILCAIEYARPKSADAASSKSIGAAVVGFELK